MSMSLCRITAKACFGGEVENAIERGVRQAGCFTRPPFADTNSLWMLNSPMPVNTRGRSCRTADVIEPRTCRRVESGDHRSKRACSGRVSDGTTLANVASVNE
jgi:hypothetical protein